MLEIVKYGNDVLKQKSIEVKEFDEDLKKFIDEMYETMKENHGIGLAAVQVGVLKNIIIVDTHEEEGIGRVNLINPKITAYSVKTTIMEEGCLSIPDVYADVERPVVIKLKAQTINGEKVEMTARGLLARVIQHEIDHLSGELFVEKIDSEDFDEISEDLELIKQGKKAIGRREIEEENEEEVERIKL